MFFFLAQESISLSWYQYFYSVRKTKVTIEGKQVLASSQLCNPQMRGLFLYETMNGVQKKIINWSMKWNIIFRYNGPKFLAHEDKL